MCLVYGYVDRKLSIFGFDTVRFEDWPAASLLKIALTYTAEMDASTDPLAAVCIKEDRYMDDLDLALLVKTPVLWARKRQNYSKMGQFLRSSLKALLSCCCCLCSCCFCYSLLTKRIGSF